MLGDPRSIRADRPRSAGRFPETLATLLVACGLAADVKLRSRDPFLAVRGNIDGQIMFELAIWGAAGAWLVWQLRDPTVRWYLARPRQFGSGLKALTLFFASAVFATLYSTSPELAVVRSVQWGILCGFGAIGFVRLVGVDDLRRFWQLSRRLVWVFAVIATTATAIIPAWTLFEITFDNASRLRWFAMRPVGTGGILGLMLVLLLGASIGARDTNRDTLLGRVGLGSLFIGLGVLLGATKSRGAMIAALAATIVMLIIYPRRHTKRLVGLASLGLIGIAFTSAFAPVIDSVLLRGQSLERIQTLTGRTDLLSSALPLIEDRPWFGYGFMSTRAQFLELEWGAGEAHNMVLGMMFSRGVVGLFVLLILGTVLFRTLQRLNADGADFASGLTRELRAIGVYLLVVGIITEAISGAPGLYAVTVLWIAMLGDTLKRLQASAQDDATRLDSVTP